VSYAAVVAQALGATSCIVTGVTNSTHNTSGGCASNKAAHWAHDVGQTGPVRAGTAAECHTSSMDPTHLATRMLLDMPCPDALTSLV
jgi:hypothetical protein